MRFDSYHKWLGIPPEKQPPHYYQLLNISVNEQDREVIQTAAERQRSSIEAHLHGAHHREATKLIYEIDEAELTLLNDELREDYDKRIKLVLKRQKNKQNGRHLDPDSNQPVGEGSGLLRRYVGIVSVILTGFVIMAYFAYQPPRNEEEKKRLRSQPISLTKKPASAKSKPPAGEKNVAPVPPPTPIAQTEAEAITWIFSVGGKIKTSTGRNIARAADLPPNPFEVITVDLNQCNVTDETLRNILPLKSVQSLLLNSTKIATNSMAVFNQLKNLKNLYIAGTNMAGQGLAQLDAQLNLRSLYINNNMRLDDEDIKYVIQYPQLTRVSLAQTSMTGQSLSALTSLKNLITIQIHLTKIDDTGLEQLQAFPNLQELLLGGPLNSESAIVKTLQYFNNLKILWIFDVEVTDASINRLASMNTLKEIRLIRTNVTDANINRLKEALPDAKINVEK